MRFKEIDKNGTVEGFALVKHMEKKTSKNGSYYLDMVLADLDGEISAKLWDYKEDIFPEIPLHSIVKVRGVILQYNGMPQFRIDRIRPAIAADNVKLEDFVPTAEYTGEMMMAEIRRVVEGFKDSQLKALVNALLDEYEDRLLVWPAAVKLHHAFRGGLLYHTLSIIRLAQAVSKIYPSVDEDLLLTGVILHDIAKTEEFNLSPAGLAENYTADGMLIGHLVRGAMAVERVGKELKIDHETLMCVQHMLISHHGSPEYGAVVRPMFLEAELLSQLDLLDSRIYEIVSATAEVQKGDFTPRQWAMEDRRLYNHGRKPLIPEAQLGINPEKN